MIMYNFTYFSVLENLMNYLESDKIYICFLRTYEIASVNNFGILFNFEFVNDVMY